jgi:hypothetical protein
LLRSGDVEVEIGAGSGSELVLGEVDDCGEAVVAAVRVQGSVVREVGSADLISAVDDVVTASAGCGDPTAVVVPLAIEHMLPFLPFMFMGNTPTGRLLDHSLNLNRSGLATSNVFSRLPSNLRIAPVE